MLLAQRQAAQSCLAVSPTAFPSPLLAGQIHSSASLGAISEPLSGITKWLAQKMPTALGGMGDGMEDLDIESAW